MAGPLDGIRIVEITMFQQGPVAGMRLGDMGADVIKVEPKTGDPARGFMRIIGTEVGLKGRNYYFENLNRWLWGREQGGQPPEARGRRPACC